MTAPLNIAIVGAGWAGLAAAVSAIADGHQATLFEASSAIGGRARALKAWLPDGSQVLLDNGQHILIGAYTETLKMMRLVGVATDQALAGGSGFQIGRPRWTRWLAFWARVAGHGATNGSCCAPQPGGSAMALTAPPA